MVIDTRNLSGARASSAVRCIAKAEHEALGTPGDPEAQAWLQKHFRRGVNVGRAWATGFAAELGAHDPNTPETVQLEAEIPWGLGWIGHADMLEYHTKTVYEAYHAAGGEFREVKALQAAFYADELGPEWKAELAVIDTADVSDEDGFAVQPYEINVDGLRERVRDIKARVVAAVEAGEVNPADRVGDSPHHQDCRSCPFQATCWAGWQPPSPSQVDGLETTFEELRITESDLHHSEAKTKLIKERRDGLRDQVREYLPAGVEVECGGTRVRRTEVAGRVTFKISDARKAGYALPDELVAFVSEGRPSERWKVDAV